MLNTHKNAYILRVPKKTNNNDTFLFNFFLVTLPCFYFPPCGLFSSVSSSPIVLIKKFYRLNNIVSQPKKLPNKLTTKRAKQATKHPANFLSDQKEPNINTFAIRFFSLLCVPTCWYYFALRFYFLLCSCYFFYLILLS